MGNFHISVQGIGCHHNKQNPTDADQMFEGFVAELKKAGHNITAATITCGGCESAEQVQQRREWDAAEAAKASELPTPTDGDPGYKDAMAYGLAHNTPFGG